MIAAGCEIVRLAVPDNDAAIALKAIRKRVPEVPIVADIHFHYKLALMALEAGIDKLRLNPGNIGKHERIVEVVRAAQAQKVPIRIGVNGGSLEKDLLKKYGTATPEAMVESAMRHIQILEDLDFTDIVISLKAPDAHPGTSASFDHGLRRQWSRRSARLATRHHVRSRRRNDLQRRCADAQSCRRRHRRGVRERNREAAGRRRGREVRRAT